VQGFYISAIDHENVYFLMGSR